MYWCIKKVLLTGLVAAISWPSLAANSALDTLLQALYENGTIDKATYELVKQTAQAEAAQRRDEVREISVAESRKVSDSALASITKAKPTVAVGGRVQVDAGAVNEDEVAHNSGTELRRIRLYAQGQLHNDWGYKLQYDFTSTGSDGIKDAYLEYRPLNLIIGHKKEPFSLQNMTSSKYLTFIERGLPNVFSEGRNIGVLTARNGDNWTLAGGIFGDGVDGSSNAGDDEGWGVSLRGTFTPIDDETHTFHLGGSLAYRDIGGQHELRFRERPEAHITNTRVIDTDKFDADSLLRSGVELIYIQGRFHWQGEYYHAQVDRKLSGSEDLNFSGYYLETGLFLSDDRMNYKASKGKYSGLKPTSGKGAWQVAVRFSALDLNDEDVAGGEAKTLTLGLNWFATPSIRFSANYINLFDMDDGPTDGDEPELFQFRSQVVF